MRLELGQSLCAGKLMFLPQNLYLYYASYTQIVLPFIVFADELYPLLPYLLRHYPGEEATHDNPKWIYNYRHGKMRSVVESALGIMAKIFRIYFEKLNLHLNIWNFLQQLRTISYEMIHANWWVGRCYCIRIERFSKYGGYYRGYHTTRMTPPSSGTFKTWIS